MGCGAHGPLLFDPLWRKDRISVRRWKAVKEGDIGERRNSSLDAVPRGRTVEG